jgi:hypothetical protein
LAYTGNDYFCRSTEKINTVDTRLDKKGSKNAKKTLGSIRHHGTKKYWEMKTLIREFLKLRVDGVGQLQLPAPTGNMAAPDNMKKKPQSYLPSCNPVTAVTDLRSQIWR